MLFSNRKTKPVWTERGNEMLYILYGEDESRMEYKLETIKEKEKCDQLDRFNARKDPKDQIENALETFSLFAQKPMVIIEQASFLAARNETPLDPARIEARIPDDKVVVLLVPARKLDSRKKAVKALSQKGVLIECRPLDEKSQPGEVWAMLKEKKLKMDEDAFAWFCENAGFSSAVLSSQLDKLALYGDHLHLKDVQALTTVEPTKNVFRMSDALFARDRVRLLELYRTFRRQNMEPQAILGLLAGQIRFVYQVRVCLDAGLSRTSEAGPKCRCEALGVCAARRVPSDNREPSQ